MMDGLSVGFAIAKETTRRDDRLGDLSPKTDTRIATNAADPVWQNM